MSKHLIAHNTSDERRPTTNLDQENINALAEALAEYAQLMVASPEADWWQNHSRAT